MTYNIPIDEFISKMAGTGVASPNRYWAEFSLPSGISGGNWGALNESSMEGQISAMNTFYNNEGKLSIRCLQMQMPGRAIMTTENRHTGTPYKLPYAVTYDALTFTFIGSEDLRERKFFEIWQETVVNISSNSLNFYDEYVSDIRLYQLNKDGEKTYEVKIVEAYPINIGQIDYSYATINEYVAIPVTFIYRKWINMAFAT